MENLNIIEPSILKKDDVVHYFAHEKGKFFIEVGTVKSDNIHKDGVDVVGEGWKQYVGKWFIQKVERSGATIFQQEQ